MTRNRDVPYLWSKVLVYQSCTNTLLLTHEHDAKSSKKTRFEDFLACKVGNKNSYLAEIIRDIFGNRGKGYSVLTDQTLIKTLKSTFAYLNAKGKAKG